MFIIDQNIFNAQFSIDFLVAMELFYFDSNSRDADYLLTLLGF